MMTTMYTKLQYYRLLSVSVLIVFVEMKSVTVVILIHIWILLKHVNATVKWIYIGATTLKSTDMRENKHGIMRRKAYKELRERREFAK